MKAISISLFGLALAASCTRAPDRIAFAEPVAFAQVQDIYVTTGRLPSTGEVDLKQDRNAKTRFKKYAVSIPPTHAVGQIEWPDGPVDPTTDFAVFRRI